MEAKVTERLGAGPHERTPDRTGQRNGHRPRLFDSRVGALELAIPKMRTRSYFPDWLLEPRRRAERALVAVIQEAYVKGVSTRKVDDLVRAMGATRMSKSEGSRLVGELDTDLAAFRERRLDGTRYPYLWLDAQYEKVRDGGRIVNAAFLLAIAANERGEHVVLGCTVAAAESDKVSQPGCGVRAVKVSLLRAANRCNDDPRPGDLFAAGSTPQAVGGTIDRMAVA